MRFESKLRRNNVNNLIFFLADMLRRVNVAKIQQLKYGNWIAVPQMEMLRCRVVVMLVEL